jgi:hypothetical protein
MHRVDPLFTTAPAGVATVPPIDPLPPTIALPTLMFESDVPEASAMARLTPLENPDVAPKTSQSQLVMTKTLPTGTENGDVVPSEFC